MMGKKIQRPQDIGEICEISGLIRKALEEQLYLSDLVIGESAREPHKFLFNGFLGKLYNLFQCRISLVRPVRDPSQSRSYSAFGCQQAPTHRLILHNEHIVIKAATTHHQRNLRNQWLGFTTLQPPNTPSSAASADQIATDNSSCPEPGNYPASFSCLLHSRK
jgi:hypothetical protein